MSIGGEMKALDDPRVAGLIAKASAAHWGRPPLEAGTDSLEGWLREKSLPENAFERIGCMGAAAVTATIDAWTRIDALLHDAADRLLTLAPAQTRYAARREVVLRFRAIDYDRSAFNLKPEQTIALPADAPPAPARDERFEHLFHLESHYWLDPVYAALGDIPPIELPDGAILALCSLWRIDDTGLRRGDDWGVIREDMLRRYGTRLEAAALHYLADPAAHGWQSKVVPNVTCSKWFPPPAGRMFAVVAADWPAPNAENFLRLLLEAGWNHASKRLPDQPWARAVLAEFQNSPYGPPDRPIWAL